MKAIRLEDDLPVEVVIETPDASDWRPDARSSEEAYPFDAVLRTIADCTGRRVEVYGATHEGRTEVWKVRDLGPAPVIDEPTLKMRVER